MKEVKGGLKDMVDRAHEASIGFHPASRAGVSEADRSSLMVSLTGFL